MNQTPRRVTAPRQRRTAPPELVRDMLASHRWWTWLYEATDQAVNAWLARPRIGDTRPGGNVVTFKPRDHFRADGQPKVKRTLAEAQRFCLGRPEARFYRCSVCREYHVGHKPRVAISAYPAILSA